MAGMPWESSIEVGESYQLQEPAIPYSAGFGGKKSDIGPENTYFWNIAMKIWLLSVKVVKRGDMKKVAICGLISILVVFSPLLSSGSQTKGIEVVVKDTSGRKVGLYKGSHALVIGVSNYTAGWPKLESIPYEIEQVEASLKKQGFHVVKVMDPTSDDLNDAFEDFMTGMVLIRIPAFFSFFRGTGIPEKEERKDILFPLMRLIPDMMKEVLSVRPSG